MKTMQTTIAATVLAGLAATVNPALAQQPAKKGQLPQDVARGRYLVQISGCNDCHTPGYALKNGLVDEKLWLTGDALGWRGPWGTTYAANLRLTAQTMPEDAFVKRARSELRPPMPWFNVRDMAERDVRAIYHYLKHMGPAGEPAPAYLPPDKEPKPPFVQFPAPPPK